MPINKEANIIKMLETAARLGFDRNESLMCRLVEVVKGECWEFHYLGKVNGWDAIKRAGNLNWSDAFRIEESFEGKNKFFPPGW